MQKIVDSEIAEGTSKGSYSCTVGLLWLKRCERGKEGNGRIQDFPKGGVETRDTKSGGGGGGGGAVRFRPNTKSGAGGGGGLLSRRGGGTIYERGVATPKPPPPPPPPPPPLYPPLGNDRDGMVVLQPTRHNVLLLILRALEFVYVFLDTVLTGEQDLVKCANKAYEASLKRYHGWLVKGIFAVSA